MKAKSRIALLFRILLLAAVLAIGPQQACAVPVSFDQLDWYDNSADAIGQADSERFRLVFNHGATSDIGYFNLLVDTGSGPEWAVRNMSVANYFGLGSTHTVSTFLDLPTGAGVDVSTLTYYADISATPTGSFAGTLDAAPVRDLDWMIGGDDEEPLPSPPGLIDWDDFNAGSIVVQSATLPDLDKFVNQPQGQNECAPGAISNSLKYLAATGKMQTLEGGDDIDDIKEWTPWISSESGTATNWYSTKETYLEGKGFDVQIIDAPLSEDDIDLLIKKLKEGQDIEMDLKGHVETLVGLRVRLDGTIELDLYDDNQKDNLSDPMHTSTIQFIDGVPYVDGMVLERFVVESIPEPMTLSALTLAGLGLGSYLRKRRR